MTDREKADIRARLDAATPGPWSCYVHETSGGMAYVTVRDKAGKQITLMGWVSPDEPNAEIIANAPADLAALLAYVEQLEGLLRDLCHDSLAAAEVLRLRGVAARAAIDLSRISLGDQMGRATSISSVRTALRDALTPPEKE